MSCSPGMAFPPAGAAGLDSARHSFARQSPSGMSILACQFSIHPFVSQRTLPISSILCFVPGIVPAAANCPSGGPENTLPRLLAVFFPDTAACRGLLGVDFSAATACFSTRLAPAASRSFAALLGRAAACRPGDALRQNQPIKWGASDQTLAGFHQPGLQARSWSAV